MCSVVCQSICMKKKLVSVCICDCHGYANGDWYSTGFFEISHRDSGQNFLYSFLVFPWLDNALWIEPFLACQQSYESIIFVTILQSQLLWLRSPPSAKIFVQTMSRGIFWNNTWMMIMFSSVIPRCLQDCRHMWCHTCCKLKDWVGGVFWEILLLSKQIVSVCCVFIRLWNWAQREWWCTSCNFFAFGISHLFYMTGSYEDKLG